MTNSWPGRAWRDPICDTAVTPSTFTSTALVLTVIVLRAEAGEVAAGSAAVFGTVPASVATAGAPVVPGGVDALGAAALVDADAAGDTAGAGVGGEAGSGEDPQDAARKAIPMNAAVLMSVGPRCVDGLDELRTGGPCVITRDD